MPRKRRDAVIGSENPWGEAAQRLEDEAVALILQELILSEFDDD